MELISIDEIQKFQDSRVIKEIPMLTDQLMATLLFIGSNTHIPAHTHSFMDEIDYVIRGTGKITVDSKSKSIHKGMMILVPKGKSHYFSTSKENLIIMAISPIIGGNKDAQKTQKTGKKSEKEVKNMARWRCIVCNYVHEGDAPPVRCPKCGAPQSKFVKISD